MTDNNLSQKTYIRYDVIITIVMIIIIISRLKQPSHKLILQMISKSIIQLEKDLKYIM